MAADARRALMSPPGRTLPRMAHQPLSPDVLLSITLSGLLARNKYTKAPGPVVAELLAIGAGHPKIIAEAAGMWVGFYEDPDTQTLATALRELPDLEPWIRLGRERRDTPRHTSDGFRSP